MRTPKPSDARRDEIAGAAAVLFNERGFHQTSMEDVAEAIGVRKPTLYHYVKSKAELVSWIHDECVAAVLPNLEDYVAQGVPEREILVRVARDILGLLESKPGYLRVYFEHHRELPTRQQSKARRQRDNYYLLVKRVLESGAAKGEFHVEDPGLTAFAFFGMCNWAYQWFRPDGSQSSEAIAKRICEIFLRGILVEPAPRNT